MLEEFGICAWPVRSCQQGRSQVHKIICTITLVLRVVLLLYVFYVYLDATVPVMFYETLTCQALCSYGRVSSRC